MRSIKEFIQLVWRCSTTVTVFNELSSRSVGQGIRYLYLLFLLLSATWTLPILALTPSLVKSSTPVVGVLSEELPKLYPSELEIVVERGELRANVPQPYYLPIPPKIKAWLDQELGEETHGRKVKHLLEIDTNASIEDYLSRESFILVTKRSVVGPDRKKGFDVAAIPSKETFTLNKSVYDSYLPDALYYLDKVSWFIAVAFPALILVSWLVLPIFKIAWLLGYLLLTSLFLLVVSKVVEARLSYGRIFAISLYGVTFPLAVELIVKIVLPFPTLLFTLVFLGWMSVVLASLARSAPPSAN